MTIRKNSIRIEIPQRVIETRIAVFILGAVLFVASFQLFGCKDHVNTASALDAANHALVVVDVAADATVEAVRIAQEERIRACREKNLPTPEQREACLGKLAEPLEPKAKAAAEAYDAAVQALAALAQAITAIEELRR